MRPAVVGLAMLLAVWPVGSAAASTPDPATLKAALADAPTSDYVEADQGTKAEGTFDASGYAAFITSDTAKQTALENTLARDNFVSGYGRLWAKTGAGAALVEQILAFKDHSGAMTYYETSKLGDLSATFYKGSIDTSSIPTSYGAKELLSSAYTSAIVFVKGNDLFAVGLVSLKDYLVSDTISQAQKVYSAAPDYTIQPATSTGATSNALASKVGAVIVDILLVILGLGILIAIIAFVVSRRRRPALVPAAAGAMIQMSTDSHFWWDGISWQDANMVAPGHAQRTPDGAYWWDGQAWHPVPRPQ